MPAHVLAELFGVVPFEGEGEHLETIAVGHRDSIDTVVPGVGCERGHRAPDVVGSALFLREDGRVGAAVLPQRARSGEAAGELLAGDAVGPPAPVVDCAGAYLRF